MIKCSLGGSEIWRRRMDTEFEKNSGDRRAGHYGKKYTGGRPRHEKSLTVCQFSLLLRQQITSYRLKLQDA